MAAASRVSIGAISVMAIVSVVLVILAITSTNPAQIGPLGVTVWFLILGVALAASSALVIHLLKRLFLRQGVVLNPSASLRQGLLIGLWGTINLALSSLRQLSLRDLLLSGLLIIIIELYLRLK